MDQDIYYLLMANWRGTYKAIDVSHNEKWCSRIYFFPESFDHNDMAGKVQKGKDSCCWLLHAQKTHKRPLCSPGRQETDDYLEIFS